MMRQTLDNAYMVNHPRNVLHPDVNMDDYVNVRPNGAVRLEDNTQVLPQNAIFPLTVPSMGASSLQIIQYLDSERAQATGTLMANQGLDADAIAKETATRFDGVRDDAQAKIELVARTFAETGFRKLYEGAAWMFSRFQDSAKEIMVLGKPLTVDPTRWRFNHHTVTNVGLGSGNSSQVVASLQGLLGIQQQLSMQQSPIVDQVKIYNTLDEIVQGLGFKSTDEFFNDPNRPDQLVEAENQILKSTLQQMQLQLQKTQNPLAESEQIRAQAKLIEAQGKQQLDIAKLQEQIRQFNIKTAQDQQQHNQDIAVDLTKIEADTGKDIPGSAI